MKRRQGIHMKITRNLYIGSFGVEFDHDGDSVMWLWPWKRSDKKKKFLSFGFNSSFETLEKIDDLWKEYFDALKALES
jgi:hypothetical protein